MHAPEPDHYTTVAAELLQGTLVPLFGAGVNLCGRPKDLLFQVGACLPSGEELARHLAENPRRKQRLETEEIDPANLFRVSQDIVLNEGPRNLYRDLHAVFDAAYPPTPVHHFFAGLPARIKAAAKSSDPLLIITTNYDVVMEQAFRDAGEPFEVVSYVSEGENSGKFVHSNTEGRRQLITVPNEYPAEFLKTWPVILKIHGDVVRGASVEADSYVITEEHYVDYLTRSDISSLVPPALVARIRESHILFLGYSLRDWNLRVMLHRIWRQEHLSSNWWAIQFRTDKLDRRFWAKRGLDIFDLDLAEYIRALDQQVSAQLGEKPGPTAAS